MSQATLSVVVPVFRNHGTLRITFENILSVRDQRFPELNLEVVFVDDGSDDDSWDELTNLQKLYPGLISLVKLSTNFGQVIAIIAGYDAAQGDAMITLSADLQDPATLIADMVKHWRSGSEVVVAHRIAREDDFASAIFSRIAYAFARSANPKIPVGGFDYLLLSRRAAKLLCSFEGRHRFFQGDVMWLGLPTAFIPYQRQRRPLGRSGWSFSKKVKYFTDLILASSYLPIRMMSTLGFLTALIGLSYAAVVIWLWFNQETPFPGYVPLMVTLLVVSGMIMMMLGMIGEYLWRIYDDVKRRPLYIVQKSVPASTLPTGSSQP